MSNNGNHATADSFLMPASRESGGGSIAQEKSSRAVAEVQAAMAIAKRFPRDEVAAMDRIKNACARPKLAEEAMYSYKRGGTDITGPSIVLAKAIAQQWGNLKYGVVEIDQENGESTVEAFAWDLETNTHESRTFHVPHIRTTKTASTALTDPRDIYETVANNASRRLRACLLGVIPNDVVQEAIAACEQTLSTKCDVGPESQKKLVAAFREIGVSREQIEKRIQCRIDAIKPAQMVQLRKIFASIRDEASTIADWFEATAGTGSGSGSGATTATADALTSGQGTTAPRETVKPAKEEPNDGGPTNADLAGTIDHSAETTKMVDPLPAILNGIAKAKTADAVDKIVAEEQAGGGHTPEVDRKIAEAGEARKATFKK
jgi:hypothetical protein